MKGIMEKIRNESNKAAPDMSTDDVARDLLLIKLHERQADIVYEKKNMMAMVEDARIREMNEGDTKLRSPVGGETLSEKKLKLKQSLEDKKMLNKLMKKEMKKQRIQVSEPPTMS